jgi:hypothetical protein
MCVGWGWLMANAVYTKPKWGHNRMAKLRSRDPFGASTVVYCNSP